jgi:hypothetical protein
MDARFLRVRQFSVLGEAVTKQWRENETKRRGLLVELTLSMLLTKLCLDVFEHGRISIDIEFHYPFTRSSYVIKRGDDSRREFPLDEVPIELLRHFAPALGQGHRAAKFSTYLRRRKRKEQRHDQTADELEVGASSE